MIDVADSSAVYYYHYDGLGSVVALSNSSGNSCQSYVYSAYGRVWAEYPEFKANPYMFTGRRFDYETGLYYYRARYYNPYIGRFLQTDPIGYDDGINWYLYCKNNPMTFVDPSGFDAIFEYEYSNEIFHLTGEWNLDGIYAFFSVLAEDVEVSTWYHLVGPGVPYYLFTGTVEDKLRQMPTENALVGQERLMEHRYDLPEDFGKANEPFRDSIHNFNTIDPIGDDDVIRDTVDFVTDVIDNIPPIPIKVPVEAAGDVANIVHNANQRNQYEWGIQRGWGYDDPVNIHQGLGRVKKERDQREWGIKRGKDK